MQVLWILCVVMVFVLGEASQGAEPAAGGKGSGTERPLPKEPGRRPTPRVPRKDVEDIERFVEENPDAALDMSHLKSLDAELAEALICHDDEPRSVTRKQKIRYHVAVPVTVDGEPSEELEVREQVLEYTVEIPGKPLYLGGLESLSPETASVLSGHTGDLYLDGLKSFPPDVAWAFCCGNGGMGCLLSLDGVDTLDDESAGFLSESRWDLSLRGVKRLSDHAYDALLQRRTWVEGMGKAPPTLLLSPAVIIEKRLGHGTMIALSAMPAKGTLESYLGYLSRISGTRIVIDEEASKALGTDATKTVSIEEWRAVAFNPLLLSGAMAPRWAPPHNTPALFPGGVGGTWPAPSFPVEQVVDLLLNMLDTRGSGLVVLTGEAGIFVTTRATITTNQRQEKTFVLEDGEVRVRLPSGEQAFMKRVGGTAGSSDGMGGGAF